MADPDSSTPEPAPRGFAVVFWAYAASVQFLYLVDFLPRISASSAAFRRLVDRLPDWMR